MSQIKTETMTSPATAVNHKKLLRRIVSGFGMSAAVVLGLTVSALAVDSDLRANVFHSPWVQKTFAFELEEIAGSRSVTPETSSTKPETKGLSVRAMVSKQERSASHIAVVSQSFEGAAKPLSPGQKQVAKYISKRYRVSHDAIEQLVRLAWKVGKTEGVEPTLILAISGIESSYNPYAASSVGAKGLMQVMAHIHKDKFEALSPEGWSALNPELNMRVGAKIIKEYIRRGGSTEEGLRWYVGAAIHRNDGGYPAKVLGLKSKIDSAYHKGKLLAVSNQKANEKLSAATSQHTNG